VELRYSSGSGISDIAGRTIKPDGTIIELAKEDVHDRVIAKDKDGMTRAKAFALPGVEPGAIIEYRWQRSFTNARAQHAVIPLQRNVPIQRVRLAVRPRPATWGHIRIQSFGVALSPLVQEAHGGGNFNVTTATNLPAIHREPDMPPERDAHAWVHLFYTIEDKPRVEDYWLGYARFLADRYEPQLKPAGELNAALPNVVRGAASPLEKLTRICEFCRTQIKHVPDDADGLSLDPLFYAKQNKSASDTLKRGSGTNRDIDELFGALVATAGLEPHVAMVADREHASFKPQFLNYNFLRSPAVAVPVEGRWLLYSPSARNVPCGHLRWQNEGSGALIADGKDGAFLDTPLTPADESQVIRTGTLRLASDGTLEGDATLTFTGHAGAEHTEDYDGETAQLREALLQGEVREHLTSAELSNIELQNVTDTAAPLTIRYHVRVPGYAQRTGKRLLVQPSFFKYGQLPRFTASERRHDIHFKYPWSEIDRFDIELPEGFELERAEGPGPVKAGDVLDCDLTLAIKAGPPQVLHVERHLQFRGLRFARSQYPTLKQVFEAVNALDRHVLALKQTTAAP